MFPSLLLRSSGVEPSRLNDYVTLRPTVSFGLITQNNYSYTSYTKWMESDTLLLHCLQGSEKLCKKNLPYRKVCSYLAPFLLHLLYHHEIRAYYLQMFQKDIPSFPVAYFTSSQSIHQSLKYISALLFC